MTAYLVARSGSIRGRRYRLDDQLVLGRQPGCDILVDLGAASRRHAKFTREGDDCYVEDLGSRNFTFLNGERVEFRRPLHHGDAVRVCDVELIFQLDPPPSPEAGTTPMDVMQQPTADGRTHHSSSTFVVDEDDSSYGNSSVISKVDLGSTARNLRLSATAEARLKGLLEITRSMGRAVAPDEVFPKVIDSLFKIFPQADRGFIVLETPDGELAPRWARWRRETGEAIRISRAVVREVMASQEAILSTNASDDPRFDSSDSMADIRIGSMMCAPLIDNDGRAFGVLQIDAFNHKSCFTPEDLEVLAGVATQAAIGIENAQLYEEALARREMERELQLAWQVQHGFLPAEQPEIAGYAFFNYYRPAKQVGGDYFDYVPLPDGRLAVIVADVVGKGVAAALLMAKLAAEMRFLLASHREPSAALTSLNERFTRLEVETCFVTLLMCVLDPPAHEVSIVGAGHMPPLARSAQGEVRDVASEAIGLPLGIKEGTEYREARISLQLGESITLYTDGVTDAMNADDRLYSIRRLKKVLAAPAPTLEAMGEAIIADVHRHAGARAQFDDICLVAFGRTRRDAGVSV